MTDELFRVREEPVPTPAWDGLDPTQPLEVLEGDLRKLSREVAEARLSLDEAGREEKDKLESHLLELLEINDAFERVFLAIHQKEELVDRQMKIWIRNFRSVKRLLDTALKAQGVRAMECLDGEFDPKWHKAGETVSDSSKPDGTIVEETRRGFLWNARLLRRAEVVVVTNND